MLKFCVKVFRTLLFPNPVMDLVHVWYDDRCWSKILCSTIPNPVHDFEVKVTDLEFLYWNLCLSFYIVCFCEAFDGLIHVWSKILYGTIPNTDSEFLYKSFVINVLQFQVFFANSSMDFIQLWLEDRALSKILCSTIPILVHDLKIKVTDFEFFYVKSLQCQLLQSLWLIWIVFGMNGYKILKCFRKEKCISGELPCPATGLINFKYLSSDISYQACFSYVSVWGYEVSFC